MEKIIYRIIPYKNNLLLCLLVSCEGQVSYTGCDPSLILRQALAGPHNPMGHKANEIMQGWLDVQHFQKCICFWLSMTFRGWLIFSDCGVWHLWHIAMPSYDWFFISSKSLYSTICTLSHCWIIVKSPGVTESQVYSDKMWQKCADANSHWHVVWLTSGVSWTLVVDGLSSWGSLPWHSEKVLIFTYLMRSCRSGQEMHINIVKYSVMSQERKNSKFTMRTLPQTHT